MKNSKRRKYLCGYYWKTLQGTWRTEINKDCKKVRKTFKTEAHARVWLESESIYLEEEEKPLNALQAQDARKAVSLLPDGVSLTDAVNYLLKHEGLTESILMKDAVEEFLADKRAANLRPASWSELKSKLNPLIKGDLGDRKVIKIAHGDLCKAIEGYKGVTRDGYRRAFRNFFGYCVRAGYRRDNPANAITPIRQDDLSPGILTIKQTEALLAKAAKQDRAIVPFLVLGLFAGLRPEEIKRLEWPAVGKEVILISAKIAKTRRQRYVNIEPNLSEWLEPYRKRRGRVVPWAHKALYVHLKNIRTAAGIMSWPHDAARHSFATYHIAKYENASKTAHQLGHPSGETLYRHYRALAKKEDGEAFFAILPP